MSAPRPPAPLGDFNDAHRRCDRLVGRRRGREVLCDAAASVHIVYGPARDGRGWEGGYACASCWEEFQQRFSCAAWHPIGPACGMPGSYYSHALSRCVQEEPPVAEPARSIAEAVTT